MKTLRHAKGIECNHPHVIEVTVAKFVTCPHCRILLRELDIKSKFEQLHLSEIKNDTVRLENLDKKLTEEEKVVLSGITFKCPRCDSPMKRRVNGKTNEVFFGCKNYPRCKGTKNVTLIIR